MKLSRVILYSCLLISSFNSIGQNISIDTPVNNTVFNEKDTILFSGTNVLLLQGIKMELFNNDETGEYDEFATFYPDTQSWQVKVPATSLNIGDNTIYAEGGGGIRSNSISVCYLPSYNTAAYARISNGILLEWDDWWNNNYIKPTCNGGDIYYRIWYSTSKNSENTVTVSSWFIGNSFNLPLQHPGIEYYFWIQAATDNSGSNATQITSFIGNMIIGSLDIDITSTNFVWDGSDTIAVSVTSDISWETSTPANWIFFIEPANTYDGVFKIVCQPNPGKTKRTSIVYLIGPYEGLKSISVEQDPGYLTFLEIDRNYFVFPDKGGAGKFELSNNGLGIMPWRLGNSIDWIDIISSNNGIDTGLVEFNISRNLLERRTGIITVYTDGAQNSPQYIEILQLENESSPGWIPEIKLQTAVFYGYVTIKGQPASNGDWVGAFSNQKCIGVGKTRVKNDTAYVSMNIQLDAVNNVTFKVWDKNTYETFRSNLYINISPEQIVGNQNSLVHLNIEGKPDLLAISVDYDESLDYEIGETIEVSCEIENRGNQNATGFYAFYTLQNKLDENINIELDSIYIDFLKNDSLINCIKTLSIPTDIPLGDYFLILNVNRNKIFEEFTFDNNDTQISIEIVFNDFLCLFGDGSDGIFTGGIIDLNMEHNFEAINVPEGGTITFIGDGIRTIRVLGDIYIDPQATVVLRQLEDFHGEIFSLENRVINLNIDDLEHGTGGEGNGIGTSKGGHGGSFADGYPGGCSCGNALGTYSSNVQYSVLVNTPFNGTGGNYPGGNGDNAKDDFCSWMFRGAGWTNYSYFSAGGGAAGQHGLSSEKVAFLVGGKISLYGSVEGQGTNGSSGGNGGDYSGICAYYKGGLHRSASGGGGGGAGGAGGHGGSIYFLHQDDIDITGLNTQLNGGVGGQGGLGGFGACEEFFVGTTRPAERAENGSNGGVGMNGNIHSVKINRKLPLIYPEKYVEIETGESITLQTFGGKSFSYQWFRDNSPIPGETFSSLIVSSKGNYFCQLKSNNNCSIELLPVAINVKPDLALNNLLLSKPEYETGDIINFSYNILNVGEGFAQKFVSRYYLSTDMVLDNSDIHLGGELFDTLNFQRSLLIQGSIPVPIGINHGNYYLLAYTELDTIYHETNITNNIAIAYFKHIFNKIQCYDFGGVRDVTFTGGIIDRSKDTTFLNVNLGPESVMEFIGTGDGKIIVIDSFYVAEGAKIIARNGENLNQGDVFFKGTSRNLSSKEIKSGINGMGGLASDRFRAQDCPCDPTLAVGGNGGGVSEDGKKGGDIGYEPYATYGGKGGIYPGGDGGNGNNSGGINITAGSAGGGGAGGMEGLSSENLIFVIGGKISIQGDIIGIGGDGTGGGKGGNGVRGVYCCGIHGGGGGGGAGGGGGHGSNIYIYSFTPDVYIEIDTSLLAGGEAGEGGIGGTGGAIEGQYCSCNGRGWYQYGPTNGTDGIDGEDGNLEVIQLDSISKVHLKLVEVAENIKIETFGGNSLSYKWFLNGTEIQGSTQSWIIPDTTGLYHVELSQGGCGILTDTLIVEIKVESEQQIPLVNGWNWLSLNSLPEDQRLDNVLQNFHGLDNDEIKTAPALGGSATFYNGKWWGLSGGIHPGIMYLLNSQTPDPGSLSVIGYPVDASAPIAIVEKWNWIGFNPQSSMDLATALASLESEDNDEIKTAPALGGSATFYNGQWWGLDGGLKPGIGYLLNSSKVDELIYPDGSISAPIVIKKIVDKKSGNNDIWTNPTGKLYTMVVHAKVLLPDGGFLEAPGSKLAVFNNNECRGVFEIFDGPTGKQFQLSVASDLENEADMIYLAFDATENKIYEITENLDFEFNTTLGKIQDPIYLSVNSIMGINEYINKTKSLEFKTYPNPFSGNLNISFTNPDHQKVLIAIYGIKGQLITVIDDKAYESGNHNIEWDSNNLPNGIYYIRLQTKNFFRNQKVVKVK